MRVSIRDATAYAVATYRVVLNQSQAPQSAVLAGYVDCHGGGGRHLVVAFVRDGPLPPNHYDEATQTGIMFASAQQMPVYLDVLRNEDPVYAVVDPDAPERMHLRTGAEPVGEGERVARVVIEALQGPAAN